MKKIKDKNTFRVIINEKVTDIITLYHGTDSEKLVIKRDYIFLSTSPMFAKEYGQNLLQVKVNVGKVFNSLLLSDIKILYDNKYKLTDPNIDDEWDDIGYDFTNDEFETAQAFIDSPTNGNTWDAIESTEGVIEWLFNNGYDSIIITEDNVQNYICKRKNIKEITPYVI